MGNRDILILCGYLLIDETEAEVENATQVSKFYCNLQADATRVSVHDNNKIKKGKIANKTKAGKTPSEHWSRSWNLLSNTP